MAVSRQIDSELAELGQIATAGFFLGLRIRGSSPLLAYRTYPQAWTDTYMASGYMVRDPITPWAMTVGGTIRWSSAFLPDPFGVFRHAAQYGLNYGASVAHGPIGSLTICSMARSDRELTDEEIARAKKIVLHLHDLTEPPKSLSTEQKDLLGMLAEGSGPAEVAAALGVPEPDARNRIKQICDALFAPTPADAVRLAREYRLI